MDKDNITFSKKDALKILTCLECCIFPRESDDEYVTEERRKKLNDYSHNIRWDIADRYGFDLNEGSIDPNTLEYEKF